MGRRKKVTPATYALVGLGLLCITFMGVDIAKHGWPFTGGDEQVISIVDENGQLIEGTIPEPDAADADDVYGSVELTGETPGAQEMSEYYSDYRLKRQKVRDEEKEILQSIIDGEKTAQAERAAAQQAQIKIVERMEQEMMIEQLLAGKGFSEPVAFIQDGRVTIVTAGDISEDEARQISDIAAGVSSRDSSEVVIINRRAS